MASSSSVYGNCNESPFRERKRQNLAINKFTRLMLNDKEITMSVDGTNSRDYTYIRDIVSEIEKSYASRILKIAFKFIKKYE